MDFGLWLIGLLPWYYYQGLSWSIHRPSLRRLKMETTALLPLLIFLSSYSLRRFPVLSPYAAGAASLACLVFAIASFAEHNLKQRVQLIHWGFVWFFAVLNQLESFSLPKVLPIFAAVQCLLFMARYLIEKMEQLMGETLNSDEMEGLASCFPRHARMLLAVLLLLCFIPGGPLFLVEDVALLEAWEKLGGISLILLIFNVLVTLSLWDAYTQVFYGRHPASAKIKALAKAEPPLLYLRLGFGLIVGLSLFPFWI